MGNNIVSNVIRVFNRSHIEIESISAKIDRERKKGKEHEVYVENIGMFNMNERLMKGNRNQVDKLNDYAEQLFRICCFVFIASNCLFKIKYFLLLDLH